MAVTTPSLAKTWNGSWRPRPKVEKSGAAMSSLAGGSGATPVTTAMTVVTRMLMIRAARILSA
jgi:hypothetical protein